MLYTIESGKQTYFGRLKSNALSCFYYCNLLDDEIELEVASDDESIEETLNLTKPKSTSNIKTNKRTNAIAAKKSKPSPVFHLDFDDGEVSSHIVVSSSFTFIN